MRCATAVDQARDDDEDEENGNWKKIFFRNISKTMIILEHQILFGLRSFIPKMNFWIKKSKRIKLAQNSRCDPTGLLEAYGTEFDVEDEADFNQKKNETEAS